MDMGQFDEVTRCVFAGASRRLIVTVLGTLTLTPLLGTVRGSAKTKLVCLNGQTVRASSDKRKKLIRHGVRPGACGTGVCSQSVRQ